MPIRALYECAQLRKLTPVGWEKLSVRYKVMLKPNGEIADIIDLSSDGKNGIMTTVPQRYYTSATSAVLDHRASYIFGIENYIDVNGTLTADTGVKTQRNHKVFVQKNLKVFETIEYRSVVCEAFYRFLLNWEPEKELANTHLLKFGTKLKNAVFCFGLEGYPEVMLETDQGFCKAYDTYYMTEDLLKFAGTEGYCALTGEYGPIAKSHGSVKVPHMGVAYLVSCADPAYQSYNLNASCNSGISVKAAIMYNKMFTQLVQDTKHYTQVDGLTIMYFALKEDDTAECDFLNAMLNMSNDTTEDTDSILSDVYEAAVRGKLANTSVDLEVPFCVLGFTVNAGRISFKFCYRNKFGKVIENVIQHHKDFMVTKNGRRATMYNIMHATVGNKETQTVKDSAMVLSVYDAVLGGKQYPFKMYTNVIERLKRDQDAVENEHTSKEKRYYKMTIVRAGVLKAYLNRRNRLMGNKEEFGMSLNKETDNVGYLCGRLFAVYESVQEVTTRGKLNRKFGVNYSGASTRPSIILTQMGRTVSYYFDTLLGMNNGKAACTYYKNVITEIMNKLEDKMPALLNIYEQGAFGVGYWHQRGAMKDLDVLRAVIAANKETTDSESA